MDKPQRNKHKSRIRHRKSRRQLGSRTYKNNSNEMLTLACETVQSGQISSRDAERQFGIPRRTIVNKIKNKHTKAVGHPTALTDEEEDKIVKVLQASSSFGSPLTKLDLKLLVHEYLEKNSRDRTFKNKIPGDAWVQSFLARHADELTLRTTQNISKARAEKGADEIFVYFNNLRVTLKDIPAANIINFDETNLSDDPGSSRCIFRRGVKYPERIVNATKGNISVMFMATASGKCLPLYVVYKASNLYSEWIIGGPSDTRYNYTKSGWFDSAMFENYFQTIIIPWAEETSGTKVVICDNLSSHLSVKVIELCEQNDIKFVFIPPRSTHLTQPLDVAFFAPLKRCWRKILYQYKLKNPAQTTLNKKHFPKLLKELTETIRMTESTNIINGFKASGIFPLNPQEVLKKLPEMQEEIMSYGIDQVLVDYLKETRAPKPMQVQRSKKIHNVPGQSVSLFDLNADIFNNKPRKKTCNAANEHKNNEESFYLDDQTGLYVAEINHPGSNVDRNYAQNLKKTISTLQYQNKFVPDTLIKQCIMVINLYMMQTTNVNTRKSSAEFLNLKASASTTNSFVAEKYNEKSMQYSTKKKIIIHSDILIKAGTSATDVCLLNKVSNNIENTPFIATKKNELPECLQGKKKKLIEKIEQKLRKHNKNQPEVRKKKSARGYKKYKPYDSDSSSISDREVITVDTDDDYDTIDQEEKENDEPLNSSYELRKVEYFSEYTKNLKGNDWIIAKFATKKSIKHFVGRVISFNGEKPVVKFLRKVKQSKCDRGMTFTYPIVDDICTMYHLDDILTVLSEPTITRRGQVIFHVDLCDFNIQ